MSQWIGPESTTGDGPAGVYAYTNRFYLPCIDRAQIVGRWSTDDSGSIWLNGVHQAAFDTPPSFAFQSWTPVNITSGFVPLWNTLVFSVTNHGGVTGLRTELTASATCCNGCVEIYCPTNITVEICHNDPTGGQVVTCPAPTAFSHCGVITNIVCQPPSGSFFPAGTNVVTCSATNICGDIAQCQFLVIVKPYSFPGPFWKFPSATFTAGQPDNFATPMDPATLSACLVSAFPGNTTWLNFDMINGTFGHRISGLPPNILKAELTIRMAPAFLAFLGFGVTSPVSYPATAASRFFRLVCGD